MDVDLVADVGPHLEVDLVTLVVGQDPDPADGFAVLDDDRRHGAVRRVGFATAVALLENDQQDDRDDDHGHPDQDSRGLRIHLLLLSSGSQGPTPRTEPPADGWPRASCRWAYADSGGGRWVRPRAIRRPPPGAKERGACGRR